MIGSSAGQTLAVHPFSGGQQKLLFCLASRCLQYQLGLLFTFQLRAVHTEMFRIQLSEANCCCSHQKPAPPNTAVWTSRHDWGALPPRHVQPLSHLWWWFAWRLPALPLLDEAAVRPSSLAGHAVHFAEVPSAKGWATGPRDSPSGWPDRSPPFFGSHIIEKKNNDAPKSERSVDLGFG